MEIEGLINHTLAAAEVERSFIAKKAMDNKYHINFWEEVKRLHSNEDITSRLKNVSHIREILGSEDYMGYLIKKSIDDPLYFMGFPLKIIEFYLHLRDCLVAKVVPDQEC